MEAERIDSGGVVFKEGHGDRSGDFFPKDLICERVELIQNQKDDFSLDELSKQFHKESEAKAVLTVKTLYGDKTFYVNEIQQVLLDDGMGEVRDLTDALLSRSE